MCGKKLNPVERALGTKCGSCVRKLHKAVVEGKEFKKPHPLKSKRANPQEGR